MLTRSDFGTLVSGGVLFCLAICGCQRHRYSEHSFDGIQDYGMVAPDGSTFVNEYPTLEPSPDTLYDNQPNQAPSFPPAPVPENNPLPPLPATSSTHGRSHGRSHGYRLAQSGSSEFDISNKAGSYQVTPSQPFSYGAESETINNGPTPRPRFLKRLKMPPRLFQPIGNKVRHIFRSVRNRLPGRSTPAAFPEQMPSNIHTNPTPPANNSSHESSQPPFEPKVATQRLPITSGGDSPYASSDPRGPATLEVPEFANLIEDHQSQPTVAPTATQSADPNNYWHGIPRRTRPESVPAVQLPSPARLQPVPNSQPLPLDRGPSLITP